MNKSAVDIIIPCYNTGIYLRQAIDSALGQTYPHVNILIVDDGSTDNTREIVESYQGQIGYFHQENKGLAAARNIGITQTRGEFVCLLDADDVILPHMIQDQMDQFDQFDRVDITHGKTMEFNDNDISHPYAEIWRPHQSWIDYLEPLSVICAIHLGSAVIRRSCFERFGLFSSQGLSEQGCEDWAFWLSSAIHGAEFRYVPRVHGLYRQHPGSMSSSEQAIALRESELITLAAKMFDRHPVTDSRRLHVLSCGIKSIAARWLALGDQERFQELVELSQGVLALSAQEPGTEDSFPYSAETSPPLIYLALSKQFLDLEMPELAVVMFLKCGDIRTLRGECEQRQQSGLFDEVVGSLASAESSDGVQSGYDLYAVQGISSLGPDSPELYFALERVIPHHASLHGYVKHQLGLLEEIRGNMDKAETWLRDSIPHNPSYIYTHFELGRILLNKRDLPGAEKELRSSIALNPDLSFARQFLGRVLEAKCDFFAAEQEFQSCLELHPDFVPGRLDHAKVLAKMGKYGKASMEFLKASRIDPKAGKEYLMGWLKSLLGKGSKHDPSTMKGPF
jgi:tetratricopeptide (TPR) repeat protein